MRFFCFVNAIFRVTTVWTGLSVWDTVNEVEIGACSEVNSFADSARGFTFDALPAGGFGGAGFGGADFFLPLSLHLLQFGFFFTFGWFGNWRCGRSVDEKAVGDTFWGCSLEMRFREGNEVNR